ncbi:MAG: YafY family transcriptional regulator [Roseitalea sp.]|nr:YafY family transcriptional regulator [Roseitalea sp.]MBO6721020.1 YafY family transcriptional regulator [Roseitalea sp.]MBO6742908.1 YafY family transcriptional regulator [Roseitalea sp.]
MQRSGRLLQLLQALREHRAAVTAASLADQFGVSERTIYRDMRTLLELGVPVEGEAGTGFILQPGYFLPSMTFSRDEADAVLLGLRFVQARGDDELANAAETALSKIAEGMGDTGEAKMRRNGLTVGPSNRDQREEMATIRRAIRARRKLQMAYRTKDFTSSTRTIWPVVIGFFDGAEMLAAWCEMRKAFRHFRMDRIEALTVLEDNIPRSAASLLAEYRRIEPGANV